MEAFLYKIAHGCCFFSEKIENHTYARTQNRSTTCVLSGKNAHVKSVVM